MLQEILAGFKKNNVKTPTHDCIQALNKAHGFSTEENGDLLFDENPTNNNQIWKYNAQEDSWSREPWKFIGAPKDKFIFYFNNSIYIGQYDSSLFARFNLESEVIKSDHVADFEGSYNSGVSWAINNKGYVFMNDGELWEYTP